MKITAKNERPEAHPCRGYDWHAYPCCDDAPEGDALCAKCRKRREAELNAAPAWSISGVAH